LFFINVDIEDLLKIDRSIEGSVKKAVEEAVDRLTKQSYAHLLELAQNELHSSRDKYIENLREPELRDNVWMIILDKPAHWIEDGMPQHEMIDDLIKSKKAKTAKDGSRYLIVPFEHNPKDKKGHNKGPASLSPEAVDLQNAIKKSLKKQGTSWDKIETDEKGNPKLGKIRQFNVQTPLKTKEGPGQGRGPVGQPRQGTTGIPHLNGVTVYQKAMKDKKGNTKTVKSIMTFRIASSKQKGSGKWMYPGIEGRALLQKTYDWAVEQLEREVIPRIMDDIVRGIL